MKKSTTINNMEEQYAEWIKNPVNVGSVYIKPTLEKQTYCSVIYVYCCWIIRFPFEKISTYT